MCLGTCAPEIAPCFCEHMPTLVFVGGLGMGGTDHAPPCMGGMGAGEGERVCAWTPLALPAGSSAGLALTACKERAATAA